MTKNAPTRVIALRGTMFFFFFSACTYYLHVRVSWIERFTLDLAEIVMDNCHRHPFSKLCYYFLIKIVFLTN